LPRCRYGQDWRRQAPPFLQDCGCSVCEPCPVYLPWLQLLPEVKHLRTTSGKLLPVSEKKRTGNTTPFSVNLTRSQVSHQAAQCLCLLCLTGSAQPLNLLKRCTSLVAGCTAKSCQCGQNHISKFCKFDAIADYPHILNAGLQEPQRMVPCHPGILAPPDPPHPLSPPPAPRQAQAGLPSASAQA